MKRYHGDYLAEITHWFEVSFIVLFAVRHDNLRAHSSCNGLVNVKLSSWPI